MSAKSETKRNPRPRAHFCILCSERAVVVIATSYLCAHHLTLVAEIADAAHAKLPADARTALTLIRSDTAEAQAAA